LKIVNSIHLYTIHAESDFGESKTMTLSRGLNSCVTFQLYTDYANTTIILTNDELSALYGTVCALLDSESRKMNSMVPDQVFENNTGDKLTFGYTNMGEPFREGMDVTLDLKDQYSHIYMFFEKYEVRKIKEVIEKLLDFKQEAVV